MAPSRPAKPTRPRTNYATPPPETVDPRWILKAAAAIVALGLLCSYATLCLFFYSGQWQFVLHPSRAVPRTPASLQLPFEPVRFADDLSGQPQLTGWWIPNSPPNSPLSDLPSTATTALLLHSATGSMSDTLPAVRALHNAHLNVFVFDYRGYGRSAGRHPTQSLMQADAASALKYLTDAKHASRVIVYGQDLAASLAVTLCAGNPAIAGLILDAADGDTLTRVQADQRSRIVPIGLLFHERFPLADPLSTLHTPKLLLSYTRGAPPIEAQRAADPKLTVELPPPGTPPNTQTGTQAEAQTAAQTAAQTGAQTAAQTNAIERFLNLYVSATAR